MTAQSGDGDLIDSTTNYVSVSDLINLNPLVMNSGGYSFPTLKKMTYISEYSHLHSKGKIGNNI